MKLTHVLFAVSGWLSLASAAVSEPFVIGNVQQFYLVDASNESRLRVLNDGDTINLCEDGTSLTVCVDTSSEVSAVQMSIDGLVYPFQMLSPFCLGASNLGPSNYASNDKLTVPGTRTITGTPYKLDGVSGVPGLTKRITLKVSDCAVLPAPTKVPTPVVIPEEPEPTKPPTRAPTGLPTLIPTPQPTQRPTSAPTASPTVQPTKSPTDAPVLPEELVGSITGWYLVNTASNTFIKYISSGETIDHNMYGKDLNLCVDTKGDVGSVQMTINGRKPGYHNRAPFCLAADESRPTAMFDAVPEFGEYGTYSIVATPYFGDELQGKVGISEKIVITVIDSAAPSSPPSPAPTEAPAASEDNGVGMISKWYLVNAATNSFVRYIVMGEVIYQSVDGTSLNICVDTLGDVASVEMSINGKSFPHHNIPPFCLGADEAGPPQTFDAVNEMASTGTFSVTATPYSEDELGGSTGASQTIMFSIRPAPTRVRVRS